jgi:hypothetical protein
MCKLVIESWKCDSEDCASWGIASRYIRQCEAVEEGNVQFCVNLGRPDPDHPEDVQNEWIHGLLCLRCEVRIEYEGRLEQQSE